MATPTYPGVYIEEIPSGVRTISGVATSITAFVGTADRGPTNDVTRVTSFGEFERYFGGLAYGHPLTYSVYQYFQNGGQIALIVRVAGAGAVAATFTATSSFTLSALSAGTWGNRLAAVIDLATSDPTDTTLFNLTVTLTDADGDVVRVETYRNLSTSDTAATYAPRVLADDSLLVRINGSITGAPTAGSLTVGTSGTDATPSAAELTGTSSARTGIYALDNADIFNLMVLPGTSRTGESTSYSGTWAPALAYCQSRRAILLIGPLSDWSTSSAVESATGSTSTTGLPGLLSSYSSVYFPRINLQDPLLDSRVVDFDPCGVVAGIIARTDATRGVWKAPAGLDAKVLGSRGAEIVMTDGDSALLNPLGVNVLRDFNLVGTVVWGSRTGVGADRLASEWKYLPVRRTALYIEESLYRGSQWAVFEPNDAPLWAQLRLNIGAFMHSLFRQGAFQGESAKDAYLVKCDAETTTQDDINRGIVNVIVGFAPLKPAEFVIIKIQQLAGQVAA